MFEHLDRLSQRGEELMRTLCMPPMPLRVFLNKNFEFIKGKAQSNKGEKWKQEFKQICKGLGKEL